MSSEAPELAARLRAAGLRVTAPRLAILSALAESHAHPDAASLAAAVRVPLGVISTQAVYNVLHTLVERGLVRRIQPAGGPARYEARVGDNHHHIVCRRCGGTADVDCAVGARPCLEPATTGGFLIDEAEVTFWGLCPECVAVESPSDGERWARGALHQPGDAASDPEQPG